MRRDFPHILLVNPWIHDFAAYDFWAKPLGLLQLTAILRSHGFWVSYIDCLDRFHPMAPQTNPSARYGRGPYLKTRIIKPKGLEDIQRHFSRYGIQEEWLQADLSALPAPDLILVTSMMTYWYPGVAETIRVLRRNFSRTPLILGGIYASLCREHAEVHMEADQVVTGSGETQIFNIVAQAVGISVRPLINSDDMDTFPYPAFDLQTQIGYIPILTSKGCPFSCAYCASAYLSPRRIQRRPEAVLAEITFWHRKYHVVDFVFYDDALLIGAEGHFFPLLEFIIRSGITVRFHTPNALHIREITKETAHLMHLAGFTTIRLGLETAAFNERRDMDEKVTASEFNQAVRHLRNSGFKKEQIGAYLLAGLPNQSIENVYRSIQTVKNAGITPIIAYFTPIPHTALWSEAVSSSRYDLSADPIFTNNAVFPCQAETFSWGTVSTIKQWIGNK